MPIWVIEILLGVIGIVVTISIYMDKKRTSRVEKTERDIENLRSDFSKSKEFRLELDKKVEKLTTQVELQNEFVTKQFDAITETQVEMRQFTSKQIDEIKSLITTLTNKLEKYFEETQKLNIGFVAHISKED